MTTRPSLGLLVLAAGLLFLAPTRALAHARLKSSTPSAGSRLTRVPRELRLDFSETPELAFTTLRLLDAAGRIVSLGAVGYAADSHRAVVVPLLDPLVPGTYSVQWQTAGDDGHPVRGRFAFVFAPGAATDLTAGNAGAASHHDPSATSPGPGFDAESGTYVAIRWAEFVALLLAVGAASFRTLVLRRGASVGREVVTDAASRAAVVGRTAAIAVLLTLAARLAAQSYAMDDGRHAWTVAQVTEMLRHTVWGWGWLLQLGGALLCAVGFHAARSRRHGWSAAVAGAIALAFSASLSGHAAASPILRPLAVTADALHVLGASAWLGSLALLLLAGFPATTRRPAPERAAAVRVLVDAFSPVALGSAGLVLATGLFATWLHVGVPANLWRTRYGATLLVKLGILSIVAFTAAYNWRLVRPRLGTEHATSHLRRSARTELVVAVLVLLVTAVLVATPTALDTTM